MSSTGKPSEVPAELAAVILQHLEAAERELHGAIADLQQSGRIEQLHDWKRALAHGMAALFRGLALPLYRQHPTLAPEWIRSRPALPDEGDPDWFDFLLRRGRTFDGEDTSPGSMP
ncbi:MAG TPA: hypothetical protein VFH26_00770 [Gemmatimonadales bacterium]|nr:hypothetical protein [Gemmatimonadales bacterium]